MSAKMYVLQVWDGGKYITKTKPANYRDTCKVVASFRHCRFRVVEVL